LKFLRTRSNVQNFKHKLIISKNNHKNKKIFLKKEFYLKNSENWFWSISRKKGYFKNILDWL